MTTKQIQYVGTYAPDYARHRVIQKGLVSLGYSFAELGNADPLPLRYLSMMKQIRMTPASSPVVFGEFSNYLLPVMLEARRTGRFVIFDQFISLGDTSDDRATGPKKKIQSALGYIIDFCNAHTASSVIFDTRANQDYFVDVLHLDRERTHVAYVGAETDLFNPSRFNANRTPPLVLFYGTFIPLHGIDVIVRAAQRVQRVNPAVRFQIVGDGQTRNSIAKLVDTLELHNVDIDVRRVAYAELPQLIATATICLGIFANRPKTRRVIPNKLYQCAAMGVPVITADTPAVREAFTPEELVVVPPGDGSSLANAILELLDDPVRRKTVGIAGARAVRDRFNPERVATQVLSACGEYIDSV